MTKKIILAMLFVLPAIMQAQVKEYFGAVPDLHVSGKEFVDPNDKPVTLHGVMDTPNAYFNGNRWTNGLTWPYYNQNGATTKCKAYFTKVFEAIANPEKGSCCNLFRLHLDPVWTNDPDKEATAGGGENDISRFSANRLRSYLTELYVPIAADAIGHGLYVIIRPPGVFPENVTVGDAYNEYLMTVWDIVSQNEYIKTNSGKIMLELGNEPQKMSGHLADYFQPIVNKIRENGFEGIILLPGTGYQANYTDYNTKAIDDNNFAYAVHCYPGWYGGWVSNQSTADFIKYFEGQVPITKKPIVITEVDWSPTTNSTGHWNEDHSQFIAGNFGTWGTGTTTTTNYSSVTTKTTQHNGWGSKFKALIDKHPNISFTLQGTSTYVDMDAYLKNGTVQPAFLTKMKSEGYPDAKEACSGACFEWFYDFACGDRIPWGDPSDKPEFITYSTTADLFGNAVFDSSNGHYIFKTTYYCAFLFNEFNGKKLAECDKLIIDLNEGTVGYRLDVQIKDANGNIIKQGDQVYVIGSEGNGTRTPDFSAAKHKEYDMQALFADFLKNYPGCTVGEIRINTAAPSDSDWENWFTLAKMEMTTKGTTGISETGSKLPAIVDQFNASGIRTNGTAHGLSIVRMSDGSVRKVFRTR